MSIAQKIEALQAAQTATRTALINRGCNQVTINSHGFSSFSNDVEQMGPSYMLKTGDVVTTFYFNTDYTLGSHCALYTDWIYDEDFESDVIEIGLGSFYFRRLGDDPYEYELWWKDTSDVENSTLIWSTYNNWELTRFTLPLSSSVYINRTNIINLFKTIIDSVITKDAIDFGYYTSVTPIPVIPIIPYVKITGNYTLSTVAATQTISLQHSVPSPAATYVKKIIVGEKRVLSSETSATKWQLNYTNYSEKSLSAFTKTTSGNRDILTYKFKDSQGISGTAAVTTVIYSYCEVPNTSTTLKNDGTIKVTLNGDLPNNYYYPEGMGQMGEQSYALSFVPFQKVTTCEIADAVTTLPQRFMGSEIYLTEIIFGTGISQLPSECFSYTSINTLTLPSNIIDIGSQCFSYCKSLTTVTMTNNVTAIGGSAFAGCTKLSSINISTGISTISANTFQGCTALRNIDIPDNVTTIGLAAFSQCTNLSSLTLSSGLTTIAANAFANCSSLESIECKATTPPGIQSTTFTGVPTTIPVYVPSNEALAAYQADTNWSVFTNMQVSS